MGINKVQYGNTTLIDLTGDTVTPSVLMEGYTAHDRSGAVITGTATGGGTGAISVVDTTDTHGGTIRTITAVDISDTTAVASDVAQGKYFYTADGTKTEGTSTGGGGGLEYEEGTITVSTAVSTYYDIPLTNTHTKPPTYYVITKNDSSTYVNTLLCLTYNLTENYGVPSDENYNSLYGCVSRVSVNASGSTVTGMFRLTASSTSGDGGTSYPRYWATETRIRAYGSISYYVQGTYKWIAVWLPTI